MNMKKKIFSLLALVMATMTASATDAPAYDLTVGTNANGTVTFKVDENAVTSAKEGDQVTVTVTPNKGYAVDEATGKWYAAVANSRRIPAGGSPEIGLLSDITLTAGDYKVTIKVSAGGHEYTVSKDFKLEQKALEMEMVAPIDNCVYNGKAHEPAVTLKYGNEVLKQGTDYVVSYVDNTNAGLGVVTIKGLGNYQGTTYATFNILDKELAGDMIAAIADQSYTGQAIEPAVVVKDGEEVLEEGRDYTVTYENNVAVGTATVIVKAGTSGNYRGEVKATFNIVGTTAILAVGGSPANTTAQRYDLSGRRINGQWSMVNGQLKKGVVIVDGKKVVVK